MADRYLLESGAPDGYLLEDGSGVLLLEATTVGLDGGDDAGWLSLPGVIAGAVLVAGAIASGNARAAAVNHQDEVPYVTGNGVSYSQPYTSRAQVKPVFIQMGGGDELPVSAAPSFVDDTTPPVVFPKIEIPLPAPIWDDPQLCRILVEENEWVNPLVVPQIVVAPTFGHQDEIETTPAAPILEESEYLGPSILPVPFTGVWNSQDERPTPVVFFPPSEEDWNFQNLSKDSVDGIIWVTDDDIAPAFILEDGDFWRPQWRPFDPVRVVFQEQDEAGLSTPATPQGGGGVVYDEISIFRWYQEDPLPILAATLGIDEEPWNPPTLSLEGPKWIDSPNEEIVPQPAPTIREDDYWIGSPTLLPRGIWEIQDSQDEVLPSIRDEEPFLGASYPLGPVVQVSDYSDDIVPQPPSEINVEETYWLQPDPPRDVIIGWQFPLDVNEDFPELSTPPTPPRVEIFGGDPVKKKKSPREEIRDLLNEPSGEKVVLVPPTPELPKPLQPVARVVPSEYLPPIGVLPISEPLPRDRTDEEILALIYLEIL